MTVDRIVECALLLQKVVDAKRAREAAGPEAEEAKKAEEEAIERYKEASLEAGTREQTVLVVLSEVYNMA